MSQSKEKETSVQLLRVQNIERFSKRLEQATYHFVNYCRNSTSYLAFASRFKSKLNYFLMTITNIRYLLLLLERTVRNNFIPAVTGGHICSDKEIVLFSLPTRHGGLVISILHETAETKFMNSSKITSQLAALI